MLYNLLRTCARALLIMLLAYAGTLGAQQSFLLDFGPNDGSNGNATTSPDANGNHWTNLTAPTTGAAPVSLVNTDGQTSNYQLSILSNFSTNGINHGGLLTPEVSLLDSLAINTATQDYFFTSGTASLQIEGLDPQKGYIFRLFASRNNTEIRTSAYAFAGAGALGGELQSSGPDLGGNGYNGNNSTLYSTEALLPNTDGIISLTLSRAAGAFAYINFMVIEEVGSAGQVDVAAITVNGADLSEPNATLQLTASVAPENATFQGVFWSVDDPTVAEITAGGELVPLTNGTVTVMATTLEPESSVSGSLVVTISNQELRHFFLDLGEGNGLTTGEDPNGNFWNNLTNPEDSVEIVMLTDATNTISSYETIVSKAFETTGNGGTGLLTPEFEKLGELAVGSASGDYFFSGSTGTLTLRGLDVNSGYRFRALGSAEFTGRRNTSYELAGFNGQQGDEIQTSGTDAGGTGVNGNTGTVFRSDVIFPRTDGTIDVTVRVALGRYAYLNALRITEYPGLELCPEVDERGIVVMGSSVARGQGAPNDMGYAFQYGQLLEERFASGDGEDWKLTNISVGGNNTINVLNRWSRDLAPLCDRYVVYGLSLANEGIRNRGQEAFDQFEANMLQLINQAKERGIIPVVVGNYSRRDFDAIDYNFIKEMNLLIHQWDVPSVNVLGTNDNGSGNWVSAYEADLGHPNLSGHTEFFYAVVPSLFDALSVGKPLPERRTTDIGLSVGNDVDEQPIVFAPEETVHSFTIALDVRSANSGRVLRFESESGMHEVSLAAGTGFTYSSPNGTLSGAGAEGWSNLFLTHYYARGTTELYVDGVRVGTLSEQLVPRDFELAGPESAGDLEMRDFFFWRSGMNQDEVTAHLSGAMLKSSLEIYTPFSNRVVDGQFADALNNLAQSTNRLFNSRLTATQRQELVSDDLKAFPNPTGSAFDIVSASGQDIIRVLLVDASGRVVFRRESGDRLTLAGLPSGTYNAVVTLRKGQTGVIRIVKK